MRKTAHAGHEAGQERTKRFRRCRGVLRLLYADAAMPAGCFLEADCDVLFRNRNNISQMQPTENDEYAPADFRRGNARPSKAAGRK